MTDTTAVPNHHADYPSFRGPSGLMAALSMVTSRDGDPQLAARLAVLERGDTLIDIGCGPGSAARHAAALGATVIGIDPAPVMLRVARAITWRAGVEYRQGAAEALPCADGSATVVWSIASVHHWRDLDRGLHEVQRVLQPGGRFVAIERATTPGATGLASHGWTEEQAAELARQCSEIGFVDARVEPNQTGRRSTLAVVARGGPPN